MASLAKPDAAVPCRAVLKKRADDLICSSHVNMH